jgi:hypothetical protein
VSQEKRKKRNAHRRGHSIFQNPSPLAEEKFHLLTCPPNTLECFHWCDRLCTREQTTPILPFWGHPVRWTRILEILAHSYNTHLWGGQLGNKNPMKKSVISAHHPSILVCSWVLSHLVKFAAGALWNIDAYRALLWEYQNLGFWKYERDFRFGN